MSLAKDIHHVEYIKNRIRERMGVLPSFFLSAEDTPEVMESLWHQAELAYLDNPLPSLFKEKLFTYLSRFCRVPYCLTRHCAFLLGKGYISGDPQCIPMNADDVLGILRRPLPSLEEIEDSLERLTTASRLHQDWTTVIELESSIVSCSVPMFLHQQPGTESVVDSDIVQRCSAVLHRVLGSQGYNHFVMLLSFIRTAHYWTETHSNLVFEPDVQSLLVERSALSDWLKRFPEVVSKEISDILDSEIIETRCLNKNLRVEAIQREQELHSSAESLATEMRLRKEIQQANDELEREILERNEAEKALHESEERMRLSTRMADVAVWEYDLINNQMSRSDNHDSLYGLDQQDEWPTDIFLTATHPDDRDSSLEIIQKSIHPGGPDQYTFDFRVIWPDKSVHWLSVTGQVTDRDSKGAGTYVRGCLIDITERKHATENFNALFNMSRDGFVISKGSGEIVNPNPAYIEMLGYTPKEIINVSWKDITPQKWLDWEVENHSTRLMERGFTDLYEKEYIRKDGSTFPVEIQAYLLNKPDNLEDALIGTFARDITERKEQENQLRRSQKMDVLGQLTGGIAHDYNNMLGVVMGYSELLKEILKDQPELFKYANEILRAGERGAKLTNKLLGFSRKKTTEDEVININKLLQTEQHMLEKTLTARIQLSFELSDDPWRVFLDAGDLEDAIINLSINAMHAIEGIGKLHFKTNNEKLNAMDAAALGVTSGDYILLSITDTGCGMDEVTKEKIFEPFYSTKGEKGTGLGLAQVYGFMKRSNGAIKVYSEIDQGTRFLLYFPRYIENNKAEQSSEGYADSDIEGNEKTILVVDDETALLYLTCEILNNQGYQVLKATSAIEALTILEKEKIDLLLSDVIMPEMDGYELAAIVHDKYPTIKIQLATGFSGDRHADMIGKNQDNTLLYKPFNSQILLQKIRRLLSKEG